MQLVAFVGRRLAIAVLAAAGPLAPAARAQAPTDRPSVEGAIVVLPLRVPPSSPHVASLPPPPPGPIESRLLPTPSVLSARASASTIAVIGFAGPSPNLNDVTRAELDRVARHVVNEGVRRLELRAFAPAGDVERRKVALARALVVRAYLLDRGVRSSVEVATTWGDGEHVEVHTP